MWILNNINLFSISEAFWKLFDQLWSRKGLQTTTTENEQYKSIENTSRDSSVIKLYCSSQTSDSDVRTNRVQQQNVFHSCSNYSVVFMNWRNRGKIMSHGAKKDSEGWNSLTLSSPWGKNSRSHTSHTINKHAGFLFKVGGPKAKAYRHKRYYATVFTGY